MTRTRVRPLATLLIAALLLTGCGGVFGDGDSYIIEASFPRAVALFESSAVKTMGVTIGEVEDITILGEEVRVRMRIDGDVPLPKDVGATIVPLTLIGERNVILSPPWKPGDERAEPGHVIQQQNVVVPVEVDDVLRAFTEVLEGIEPAQLSAFISDTAQAFDQRGERFNEILQAAARATSLLAETDDDIIALIETLTDLSGSLNQREGQLARLIDTYATATDLLASERQRLRGLFRDLAVLLGEGEQFVGTLERELPQLLASLADIALLLEANLGSLIQVVASLPIIGEGLVAAFDEATQSVTLTFHVDESLGTLVTDLLEDLGLGGLLDPSDLCLPGVTC
jgi:phospholipid/cholesterol/gamma-HCH transport system substrate-binding protein